MEVHCVTEDKSCVPAIATALGVPESLGKKGVPMKFSSRYSVSIEEKLG